MIVQLSGIRLGSRLRQGIRAITRLQENITSDNSYERSHASGLLGRASSINAFESLSTQRRHFSDMPKPILYYTDGSPPSRAVRLTAAAIGIDIDIRNINVLAGEQMKEEFLKINPEHTVPTLDDNGFIFWDSHAIMIYLVDKYAKDDSLYPKDIKRRALVNQRLFFDAGVLFPRLRFISLPLFMKKSTKISSEKLELLAEAYGHLEKFLEGKQWLCGDSYTLADISCVTTISSVQCVHPLDDFPNIKAWLKRCEENLPEYATANAPGMKAFHGAISHFMTSKGKL